MRPIAGFLIAFLTLSAQQTVRTKDVREIGKGGSSAIPKLEALLSNPDLEIRLETVKQIVQIGTQHSLGALVKATRDNDPEVQIRATDGLVDFYLPGYVKTGLSASVRRVGSSIKSRFTDTNDQVIDPFIEVRPDVTEAIARLITGGAGMEVRANAARAAGVLRARNAVPALVEAVRTKDSNVIYEVLVALQKIRDESAGPMVEFLIRDFDPKVQLAAIETAGLLRNRGALPRLKDALANARDAKVRRAALAAIAMLPDSANRQLYLQYLNDRDDRMRGAAVEGIARLKNASDLPLLEKAYEGEGKTSPRLSLAFGLVMLGQNATAEFAPLTYLVNTLNSANWRGEAYAFLVEIARDPAGRRAIEGTLPRATREEKIWLMRVFAASGDAQTLTVIRPLQQDTDVEVSREALRAGRAIESRR